VETPALPDSECSGLPWTEAASERACYQFSKSETEIADDFRPRSRDGAPVNHTSAMAVNNLQKTFLGQCSISFGHRVEVYPEVDCEAPYWRRHVTGVEHALHHWSAQREIVPESGYGAMHCS
jgi:hypothetical protein